MSLSQNAIQRDQLVLAEKRGLEYVLALPLLLFHFYYLAWLGQRTAV